MNDQSSTPVWFWIVCLLAITWNGLGVVAYVSEAFMTPEQFAALDPQIQQAYNQRPAMITGAFAIAVFGGLLGSILLLLRKAWAVPVLGVSLAGVSIQHLYSFGIAKMHHIVTTFNIIMAIVVFVIALALVLFAVSRKKLGWLS